MLDRKEVRKRITVLLVGLLVSGSVLSGAHTAVVAESGEDTMGIQETTAPGEELIQTDNTETEVSQPEDPDTDTPEAGSPGADIPDTDNPDTENPDIEDPDAEDPDTEDPDTEDPDTEDPDTENPDTEDPDIEDPDIEDPDTDTPNSDTPVTDTPQPEVPEPAAPVPDEETTPSTPVYFRDNSKEAYYEERTYNPSETFIDKGEKIKYSTDMPLEDIPVFITPEMIIGALKVQDEYGYPASVTIAQIIQESGFGAYGPYGDEGQGLSYLAYQYNNLFGIKGTGPAGSVNMQTVEQTKSGESYTIRAGFRVYNTYTEAIDDRAELLSEVYSDLIEGVNDANTFAMRIGGRWATDINYAKNLICQMETYDLYRLDRMTLGEFSELLGDFADPCPGSHLTSGFGWREFRNSYHKGIDLGTGSENIPVYAAAAGTVITAGWSDSAGNWIVIDHGDGLVTKYMHHEEIYVEKGDHVEKGQQIGLSGSTGDSTGNHLHFQLEINGAAVDPLPYLYPEADQP